MNTAFDQMTPDEQIAHVQDLWDRIAARPENVKVSEAWRREIARRSEEFDADPSIAIPCACGRRGRKSAEAQAIVGASQARRATPVPIRCSPSKQSKQRWGASPNACATGPTTIAIAEPALRASLAELASQ